MNAKTNVLLRPVILYKLLFRDEDLEVICQNHCETDYAKCVGTCTGIDCLLECARLLEECSKGQFSRI